AAPAPAVAAQPTTTTAAAPIARNDRLPTAAAAPAATTRPLPAAAPPAPSAAELSRRRCAALDDYIAELRAKNSGAAAAWVGEQLQTALARRVELGC
nr:hypothetical protein [Burkholderiaceae bacterium]